MMNPCVDYEPYSRIVHAYGLSKKGERNPVNQDAWASLMEIGVFLVCDGMGGHQSGDVASKLAVCTIKKDLLPKGNELQIDDIRQAIIHANKLIYELAQSNDQYNGMGTTISLVWAHDGLFTIFHIGDSRVYRIRNYTLSQMTRDHVLSVEPNSSLQVSKGRLARALGVSQSVDFDEIESEWQMGDELVMLTDGISDVLHDFELANIMVETVLHNEGRVLALVQQAEERMGQDDKTVLHVSMPAEGTAN